jgi:hypothetical protein
VLDRPWRLVVVVYNRGQNNSVVPLMTGSQRQDQVEGLEQYGYRGEDSFLLSIMARAVVHTAQGAPTLAMLRRIAAFIKERSYRDGL